jgi:TatD DNase family protein
MILNDFHCHFYTHDSGAAMDKIIKYCTAEEHYVGMILNNIREKELWEKGAEFSLSKTSSSFAAIPFIGIHPWDSAEAGEETISALEEAWSKTRAFIGEIGFDKLKGGDAEKQLFVFRACLDIAVKSEKPFTLHCVRAWGLLTEELQKVKKRIAAPFIVHAYNGAADAAKAITALGGYLSFGLERYGAFSRKAEDSILKTDLKHILLETDFTCYSKQPEAGAGVEAKAKAASETDDADSGNSINVEYSREDNYYGNKYIKRLLAVYSNAASVLKMDITELSGVIEENGKVFKAYTTNWK